MNVIKLKPGRDKSLKRGHPWVFSGAVASIHGDPASGDTVEIQDSMGDFLAYGAFSPKSQIRLRAWSWNPAEIIDRDFLRSCLKASIAYRDILPFVRKRVQNQENSSSHRPYQTSITDQPGSTQAPASQPQVPNYQSLRLVHAESDGIPGLVVDRYPDVLVVQLLSAGVEYFRETIADLLLELTGVQHIYERSDVDVRSLEGLGERFGPLRGSPTPVLTIDEHGLHFRVDIAGGHKTGFYLDQRENRYILRSFVQGAEVLDCFCYSGGFLVNALVAGARWVTAIDSSGSALELAKENVRLNDLPLDQVEWHCEDVFQQLRRFRDQGRSFDTIILDPPKFAPTAAHARKASRGYKDINLLALKLLRPGGTLMTFSCSGGIGSDLFQKIVAGAALDAGVRPRLLAHLEQAPDHPISLNFPEGAYLKGLLLKV